MAGGDSLLSPSVTKRLIEQHVARVSTDGSAVLDRLTDRERDVLTLVAQGHSHTEIADQIVLTEASIKTHLNRRHGVRVRQVVPGRPSA